MKKYAAIKSLCYRIGFGICALAMIVATHTANVACFGKFHQPKIPYSLYKNMKNLSLDKNLL